jgi:hypothetical protein
MATYSEQVMALWLIGIAGVKIIFYMRVTMVMEFEKVLRDIFGIAG